MRAPSLLPLIVCLWSAPGIAQPSGFLLKMRDQQGLLEQSTEVIITSADGQERRATLRDDGKLPDAVAGDHIWSSPVAGLGSDEVEVSMEVGGELRTVEARIEQRADGPLLFLVLGRRGLAVAVERTEPGGSQASQTAASGTSATLSGQPWDGRVGAALAVLLCALGLLAGFASGFWTRGRALIAMVARAAPARPATPRLFAPGSLEALLAGPLASHRVLLVGPGEAAHPKLARILEPELHPAELAARANALRGSAEEPCAVVVTDALMLDAERPAEAVQQLCALLDSVEIWTVAGPSTGNRGPRRAE